MPPSEPIGVLRSLGWLDLLEESPAVSGDTRFLQGYFLPGHGRLKEEGYRGLLARLEGAVSSGGGAPSLAVRGRVLRILGETARAEADFARALRLQPGCSAALAFQAELRLVREPRAALAGLEKALRREPAHASFLLWRAYALFLLRDAGAAVESLERAKAADPGLAAARLLGGILRSRSGALLEAEQDFSAAARLDPRCPGVYTLRAAVRCRQGDHVGAVEDAHRSVMAHPENLDGFVRILYLRVGVRPPEDWQTQKAVLVGEATRILTEDPRCGWAFALRAEIVGRRGESPRSAQGTLDDLLKAARLEPGRAWIRAFLGRCLRNQGKDEADSRRSLREMDKAVELAPKTGWIRTWRAEVLRKLRRDKDAMRDFDAGLALDPAYRLANAWRAGLRARRGGDKAGAAEDLTKCLATLPRVTFYHQRAMLEWRLGRRLDALADLTHCVGVSTRLALAYGDGDPLPGPRRLRLSHKELLEIAGSHPRQALAHAWLGRSHLNAGATDAALRSFGRALSIDARCAQALAWRGELRCRMKQYARARRDLDAAISAASAMSGARLWRGAVHLRSGRVEAGLRDFLDACAGDPNNTNLVCERLRSELASLGRGTGKFSGEASRIAADLLFRVGDCDGAARILRRASAAGLGAPGLALRGIVHGQRRDWKNAQADLAAAVDADPSLAAAAITRILQAAPRLRLRVRAAAYSKLGRAFRLLNRSDDSHNAYRIAQELESDPESFTTRGRALAALGLWDPALGSFDQSLRRDPRQVWALIGKACCLGKSGRIAAAARILAKARALSPELLSRIEAPRKDGRTPPDGLLV